MPLGKEFSWKLDYKQRNVHDDLLEKLKNSTNEVPKGRTLIPKTLHLRIDEGLYDNGDFLKNA